MVQAIALLSSAGLVCEYVLVLDQPCPVTHFFMQELSNLAALVSQDQELLDVLGNENLVLTVFAPDNGAIRYA